METTCRIKYDGPSSKGLVEGPMLNINQVSQWPSTIHINAFCECFWMVLMDINLRCLEFSITLASFFHIFFSPFFCVSFLVS